MKLIVDANVLFSALINQGKTAELMLLPHLELFAPEFIMEELQDHQKEILLKTHRTEEEFQEILLAFRQIITFISGKDLSKYLQKAGRFSPDPDDTVYFALALMLECPIWSNDKELKLKQNVVKIYSTTDLFNLISLQKP